MGLRTLAAVTAGLIALATVGCGRRGDPRGFALAAEPVLRIADAGRTPQGLQWRGGPTAAHVEWLPLADWRCPTPRTKPMSADLRSVSTATPWRATVLPTTGPVAWRIVDDEAASPWAIAGPAPAPYDLAMTIETDRGRLHLASAPAAETATILLELREGQQWSTPRPLRLPTTLGPWPPGTRIELRWTLAESRNNRRFYPGAWHVRALSIP